MINHTSILKIVRFNAQNQGLLLTVQEKDFNRAMSSVSVSVEWKFGKIAQYFAYLDFKKNQKILLQPVGKLYLVGALLTNC